MGHLPAAHELIITGHTDGERRKDRHRRDADQIANRSKRRDGAGFLQQVQRRFPLHLRGRRRQMPHAHIVLVSVQEKRLAEPIVGSPEQQARKQLVARAGSRKGSRLAHQ